MNLIKKLFQRKTNEVVYEENRMPIEEWHDKCLAECPKWILEKGVAFLSKNIPEDVKEQIRRDWDIDHDHWISPFHFSYGMFIRNQLRDNVCLDDQLPTGNWDDYYVRLIEMACGIWKYE